MYNPLELRDDLKAKRTDDERDPFGRIRPEEKPEPAVTNLGDASKLNRPVGEQGKNDRRDVAKVETMLGRTGALDLKKTDGPTGYWGERTREATRAFQKQNGLKVDGQINPGGETIRALAKVAGGLIKSLVGNTQKAQPTTQPASLVTDAPTRHPGAGRDRGGYRGRLGQPIHPQAACRRPRPTRCPMTWSRKTSAWRALWRNAVASVTSTASPRTRSTPTVPRRCTRLAI